MRFLATASSAFAVLLPGVADAASVPDVGDVAERLVPQILAMGGALVYAFAAIGLMFVGTGFLKLKEAADTKGQQVGYGQGVWRIVAGSGMLAIPSIIGILQSTFGVSGSDVAALFGI